MLACFFAHILWQQKNTISLKYILGHTALITFCIQCENLHSRILAPQGLGLSTVWVAEAVQVQRLHCLSFSSSQRSSVSSVKSWQDLTDRHSKWYCPLGRCFSSKYSLTCREPLLLYIDPVQVGNDYLMRETGIANPATPADLGIFLVCYLYKHFYWCEMGYKVFLFWKKHLC